MYYVYCTIMTNIEQEIEERRLAQKLKDVCCDVTGKETNPTKAAEIIHQIGLIYRQRSPDKISLIKGAGLFNAAIVRNPSNIVQIKSDLSEICQHILHQAKAKNQSADLIKKAENVKKSINELRNEVKISVKKSLPKISSDTSKEYCERLIFKKISVIKQLNKVIAEKYKQIMTDISQFCEDVMGKHPCEYAIVGMGSLAREEITPFSDFEHIILLFDDKNYKSHLEYFKWFSVIFHIVILNVQETIVPSLNVQSLNGRRGWFYDSVTPRGISFDGMMPHACKFPLGREQQTENKQFTTELIKPVSDMLEYLSSEADLKNGYHLADILTKTCFVFGNEDIFNQFVTGVQKHKNKQLQTDIINDVRKQVKDDLDKFSARFLLIEVKLRNTINIKQLVYRSTTIFITALARIHKISANSCFDIIDEMTSGKKISQNTADHLRCAIAIACEMRLRVYIKNRSQCDNATAVKQDGTKQFLDIVGIACIVKYFQVAYCLQCEIAKQLNLTKLHFYSHPELINLTIGLVFGIKRLIRFSRNNQTQSFWAPSKFDFDTCIEQLETHNRLTSNCNKIQKHDEKVSKQDFKSVKKLVFYSFNQTDINIKEIRKTANYLLSVKSLDEALELYKVLLQIYHLESMNSDYDYNVAWANHQIALGLIALNQHVNAIKYLNRAFQIQLSLALDAENDKNIARTLHEIGRCHFHLHCYDNALTYLYKALHSFNNITNNVETHWDVSKILHRIGRCHIEMHNYHDGFTYVNRAIKIKENILVSADKHKNIAYLFHGIGLCYIDLYNLNGAITNLIRALKIKQSKTLNAKKDSSIALTLYYIGCCYVDLNNFNVAFMYFKQALEIAQNISLNENKDCLIARTLHQIGQCHVGLHQDRAPPSPPACLNRALETEQNAAVNVEKHEEFAKTIHEESRFHIDLQCYEKAFSSLSRALKIKQNTSLCPGKDRDLAVTQCVMGECLSGLQQYDDSWKWFEKALQIFQNTTADKEKDIQIAKTFNCMGECLLQKKLFAEALIYLERALKICQNVMQTAKNASTLARISYNIGFCLNELNVCADALNQSS